MKVSELMNPKGVLLYAKIDNSADALGILVELQEGIGVITNGNAYYNAVSYRETFGGTTAIGGGIALPHACNAGVSAPGISALLLRRRVRARRSPSRCASARAAARPPRSSRSS